MYQYQGSEIPQDLEQAAKYFQRAAELGNWRAQKEYIKVCGWIKKNREARESTTIYRSNRNYNVTIDSDRKEHPKKNKIINLCIYERVIYIIV